MPPEGFAVLLGGKGVQSSSLLIGDGEIALLAETCRKAVELFRGDALESRGERWGGVVFCGATTERISVLGRWEEVTLRE